MLTHSQIETIARICRWTVDEVRDAIAMLNASAMPIYVTDMMDWEARDAMSSQWADEGMTGDMGGFYGRLSMPGCLDCTDWHGPFETVEAAVADLLLCYAD